MQISLPFDAAMHDAAPAPPLPAPPRSPVFVRHPRARRYVLRVTADGGVRVTMPRRGSKAAAAAFVDAQQAWIEAQRRIAGEQRAAGLGMADSEARALRERARTDLPRRLHELAARLGLVVSRVSVRNQRWRWGSCSRSGHICLNWRLSALPDAVRDYVLVHELMHLKRMDHSAKFWKLVARACPDFRTLRRQLREFQSLLLS